MLNPLQRGATFLYPLKTLENLKVFRGYRKATPGCNGLNNDQLTSILSKSNQRSNRR